MAEALPKGSRIGILTSGGDAPGMNAAVRAAVKLGLAEGYRVLGVQNGYRGLIDGVARELSSGDVEGIQRCGGTVLGSARALDFPTAAGQEREAQLERRLLSRRRPGTRRIEAGAPQK